MINCEKLVSIIMPVFNTEKEYLEKAIDSILRQTYSHFEFIIVDDGSNSVTHDTLVNLAGKDSRIKLYTHEHNMGVAHSLNEGIRHSNGDYIVRMDSDDISLPARIEQQITFMENQKAVDFSSANVKEIDENDNYFFVNKKKKTSTSLNLTKLIFGNPIYHPTVIYRSSVFKDGHIRYNTTMKSEDYDMWVNLLMIDKQYMYYRQPVLLYRVHSSQISRTASSMMSESTNKSCAKYLQWLGWNDSLNDIVPFIKYMRGLDISNKEAQSAKLIFHALMKSPRLRLSVKINCRLIQAKNSIRRKARG